MFWISSTADDNLTRQMLNIDHSDTEMLNLILAPVENNMNYYLLTEMTTDYGIQQLLSQ